MAGGIAKALPGSVADAIGGALGDAGSDFAIHVMDGDFEFFSPLMETTGDSDSTPIFENNGLVYGRFNLRGAMVSDTALKLNNLVVESTNPVTDFTFIFHGTSGSGGSDRNLTVTIIIERIRIRWSKRAQIVGLALTGRMTNTAAASGDI